jgi:ribose/xylose/arabinose/galactoside ABC-type transport system permease subunit
VVSTIALMAFGSSPTEAYGDMLRHASKLETQVDILNRATPFYLSAVAAAIGFRMNLFNIGVEGQYLMGFLFAAQVGGLVSLPQALHILVIMLTAMIVSSLYAGLAGILKTTRGVNEVISTIMLNAIAVGGLIAWLQQEWQAELGENFSSTELGTEPIDESGLLPTINGILELVTREVGQGKELTGMFLVAVLVGVAYYVLLNRTRFGFDLRASGINPFAARAGGVPAEAHGARRHDAVGRGRRPDRHDRTRRHRQVPARPDPGSRLPGHRRCAPRSQQPGRHGVRRTAVRLPRRLVGGARLDRSRLPRDRRDHAGHRLDHCRRRLRRRKPIPRTR